VYERNIEMLKRKQSEAARALIAKRKSDEQVGFRERLSLLQQKLQAPIRIGRTVQTAPYECAMGHHGSESGRLLALLAVRALSQLKAMMSDIQKAKNMRVLIQKKLEEAPPSQPLAPKTKPHPTGRARAHASAAAAQPVQCSAVQQHGCNQLWLRSSGVAKYPRSVDRLSCAYCYKLRLLATDRLVR
jgi:hypothetical protein